MIKKYYHYFEDPKYNGWFRLKYRKFMGHQVTKIKLFNLITIYRKKSLKKHLTLFFDSFIMILKKEEVR